MLNIIKERTRKTVTVKKLEFDSKECVGAGYSFNVDENGNFVANPEHKEIQTANYKMCLNSPDKYDGPFIREYEYTRTEPAEGICKCGKHVLVQAQHSGAFSCPKCGQWYNLFGQELESPDCWEEDY